MSLIKANAVQVGQSPTATQNFTLAVPSSPDGTIKLARGNSGATTQDVISVDASGNVNGLVKSTGSNTARTLANRFADVVNVKDFGAVGDGVADDTIAIQSALNYCYSTGGGIVHLPPTGNAYRITDSLTIDFGVVLQGESTNWNGATVANNIHTRVGSWIKPEHPTNSAIKIIGQGCGVSQISFIYDQPIPSSGWIPNQYGWAIELERGISTFIEKVTILNAWNGIAFNFLPANGGGTNVWMRDVIISAFNERIKTSQVNDTMYWSNIHCRNLWYSSNADVVSYIRANTIGWRCGYTDNIMVDGLELFEDNGILLEDETCFGITHSLYNAQINNIQFNLTQKGIRLATNSVTSIIWFSNVLAQQGNAFGYTWTDEIFNFESNNVLITFNGLNIQDAGSKIATIGNGAGGRLNINGLYVRNYSTQLPNQAGISANAGSTLSVQGVHYWGIDGSPGQRIAGAGTIRTREYDNPVYPTFSTIGTVTGTGTGTWIDVSAKIQMNPNNGYIQGRFVGQVFVNTAQAGGTIGFRVAGQTQILNTGVDASTTGWKNIDTNWINLTNTTTSIGRIQFAGTTGVQINQAEMNLMLR
jgi:hypothetical protein